MTEALNDLRHAFRQLLRHRGFTAIALSILALSIAATTVVFSVINGVLLRPLAFPESERLVQIHEVERDRATGAINDATHFAWGNFADIRAEARSFQAVTAYQYYDRTLTGRGAARRLNGRMITPDFFAVFGVQPILGRPFTSADVQPGNENSALIAHGVWRDLFGSDPGIVGRAITLDGHTFTVAGVMPAGFDYPNEAELWMPLVPFLGEQGMGSRRFHRYRVVGRLTADAPVEGAQAELSALARRLEQQYPDTNTDNGFRAVSLIESVAGAARDPLRILFGAVALLLLIGCANVAGLLLVHGATREREIGIRVALGAGRFRILRQLLLESLLLAFLGGALGILVSTWGLSAFKALVGDALPRAQQVHIDGRAVAFALALTLTTGLLFGLMPALRYSRPVIAPMLRGGRSIASERGLARMRSALVIGELAVALVLATGAGLLVRSFQRLTRVDHVTDPATLLTLDVSLPEARYGEDAVANQFYSDLLQRAEALPQVISAAATLAPPLAGGGWGNGVYAEGQTVAPSEMPTTGYVITTPGYFRTTGIRLIEGRDFDATEAASRPAVIVNQLLARRLWPGESALGKRVRFSNDAPWATVVGVAADVPPSLDRAAVEEIFVPPSIESLRSMTVMLRVRPGQSALALREARALIQAMDRDVPVTSVSTLETRLSESVARPRYTTAIVSLFATSALFLASVGIYGVLAYAVTQRRRELGIRLAIGATTGAVLALVLRDGLIMAGAGVALGLAGSLAATRVLQSMLYGISTLDAPTFAAVALLTFGIAAFASWVPARRAARIDPARILVDD